MSFEITLSHEAHDLRRLREEWQALQERSGARGVYLTWEWVSTWWEHFGSDNELWLLQARDAGGRLIGLGILTLVDHHPRLGFVKGRRWRQLEYVGASHNCEHLGFVVESGFEAEVSQAFVETLMRHRRSWDALCLSGLARDGATLPALRGLDIPWSYGASMIAPYIALTDSWDEYFSRLGSDKSKAQRKRVRILNRDFPDNWVFDRVAHDQELPEVFDKLVELHQAAWEARGEPGAFGDPRRKKFLYALAAVFLKAGWLRLHYISLDGEIVAAVYSYSYRGRVYDLVSGVDWDYRKYNVGHVLTQLAIHDAVNSGVDEYDFLWGDEPYKYEWRAKDREHVTLMWFASPIARLQHSGLMAARRFRDWAESAQPETEPNGLKRVALQLWAKFASRSG